MQRSALARLIALALFAKAAAAPPPTVQDPHAGAAEHQQVYLEDGARFRVVTGGRRSGKTEAIVIDLIATALEGGECVYISLTRKLAKKTVWKRVKTRLRTLGAEYKANETELRIDLAGGGTVELGGADDREAIERYRGPAYTLVVIDECGAQNPELLHILRFDVLQPALMDHEGRLTLAGTPGPTLEGYWYDVSNEQHIGQHPVYRWTVHQNPIFEGRADAELQRVLDENEWTPEHVTFKREYLGLWVYDDSVLVYPFDRERNALDRLPQVTAKGWRVPHGEWRHVIAVDVGTTEQAMAIVVWARNRALEDDYLVHAEAHTGMLVHGLAERLRLLLRRYPGAQLVLDAGGMGKAHALELTNRYSLSIQAAEKTEKASAIRLLRDRVLAGRVKVLSFATLDGVRSEWSVLGWDKKHEQHNPDQSDHYSDACLYGLRALRNWRHDASMTKPKPRADSPEAMQQLLDEEAEQESRWIGKPRKPKRKAGGRGRRRMPSVIGRMIEGLTSRWVGKSGPALAA